MTRDHRPKSVIVHLDEYRVVRRDNFKFAWPEFAHHFECVDKSPITIGGWRRHTDGTWGQYEWANGSPRLIAVSLDAPTRETSGPGNMAMVGDTVENIQGQRGRLHEFRSYPDDNDERLVLVDWADGSESVVSTETLCQITEDE